MHFSATITYIFTEKSKLSIAIDANQQTHVHKTSGIPQLIVVYSVSVFGRMDTNSNTKPNNEKT